MRRLYVDPCRQHFVSSLLILRELAGRRVAAACPRVGVRPQCRAPHDPDHNAARNDVEGRASFAVVTRQPNHGTHGDGLAGSLPWDGCFQEFPNSKRERRWESVRTL